MIAKTKKYLKLTILGLLTFFAFVVLFTIYANIRVEQAAKERLYDDIDSVPHYKVALLLGTNPLNRCGGPNSYFINRINTAAELYHKGKVDFIIASGEKIKIPEIISQRSYSTSPGMTMKIVAPDVIVSPVDSLVVEFTNSRIDEGTTGEYFKIERLGDKEEST